MPPQLASCIGFGQFVHYLYVQKHTKTFSISQLYRFCIVCTLFICTKNHLFQVSSCFQSELGTSFVRFVHFLSLCSSLMYIFCTFIIIQNFDLNNLCIPNIYKVSVLYRFCTNFLVRPFQLASYIGFVQFAHCLYVQITYISSFKPCLV